MPRPQVDKQCLHNIRSVMQHSEDLINTSTKRIVLEMLQQNYELTDSITAACYAFARTFTSKFDIELTDENLQKLIGDVVFMSGVSPVIKALIKADEEAGND